MPDRNPTLSLLAGPLTKFRQGRPVFTWGVVGVLVFGLLGLASFYAVGPFGALACDSGPQVYVHEPPGEQKGVTPYDDLTESQQRLFDRVRDAEGTYSLNETESRIELPHYVEQQGTVYEIEHGHAECTIETNHLLGVGLLAVSALTGLGLTLWRIRNHS